MSVNFLVNIATDDISNSFNSDQCGIWVVGIYVNVQLIIIS